MNKSMPKSAGSEAGPILVVSADKEHSDVRRHILEDAGFEVVAVTDLKSLLEACKNRPFSLAIIGYSIPPAERARISAAMKQGCYEDIPTLELHPEEEPEIASVAFSFMQSAKCDPSAFLEIVKSIQTPRFNTQQRTGT